MGAVRESLMWKASSGREYWLTVTRPVGPRAVRGAMLILHGVCEYGGCYADFTNALMKQGIVTYLPDRKGHGRTLRNVEDALTCEGVSNEQEQEDIRDLILEIKGKYPTTPFLIFGHSAGSLLALYTAIYQDIGEDIPVVLCGFPGIHTMLELILMNAIYMACGPSASDEKRRSPARLFMKASIDLYNFIYRKEGPGSWLALNREAVKAYNEDPKCGKPVKSEFVLHMIEEMLYIHNNMQRTANLKLVFVYGEGDPCAEYGGTVKKFIKLLNNTKSRMPPEQITQEVPPISISFHARHSVFSESQETIDELVKYVMLQFKSDKNLGNAKFLSGQITDKK